MNWRTVLPGLLLTAAYAMCPPAEAETTTSQERPVVQMASAATGHADAGNQTRFSRDQWGLDETEWQRYQTLMTGIRGSISPATLSPIEVLGIHARDDAERMKYARLFAEIMRQDTERVLAFQRAYDQVWSELNPSGLIVDPARLPVFQKGKQPRFQTGDRLLLFVKPQDCPPCDESLRTALEGQRAGAQLDIYVVGNVSDDEIRKWAQQHKISPNDVKVKRTTLNHESGQLAQIAGPAATPPLLAIIRNSQISLLQTNAKP